MSASKRTVCLMSLLSLAFFLSLNPRSFGLSSYAPFTDGSAQPWPPEDPSDAHRFDLHDEDEDAADEGFQLPDSPWTFENGSVNPSLQPSNAFRRRAVAMNAAGDDEDEDEVYEYREDYIPRRRHIRRGSEGYEIAMSPADKEEILRRYIITRGAEAGHYKRYEPEPSAPSSRSASPSPSPPPAHSALHMRTAHHTTDDQD